MKSVDHRSQQKLTEKLQYYLGRDGRSISAIASAMNISRFAIHHWLRGDRHMPFERIEDFCDVLLLSEEERLELYQLGGYPTRAHAITEQVEAIQSEQDWADIWNILSKYAQETLDFIGYIRKGKLTYVTHPNVLQRLRSITDDPQQRVQDYREIALKLATIVVELDTHFRNLDQGRLIRNVFDVEQGGLFFYYLRDGAYIFAATIDQESMENGSSEATVKQLVWDIKKYMKLTTYSTDD